MNPYNSYSTILEEARKELRSEADANRELKKAIVDIATTQIPDDIDPDELDDPWGELK